jgi:hypothetical protein
MSRLYSKEEIQAEMSRIKEATQERDRIQRDSIARAQKLLRDVVKLQKAARTDAGAAKAFEEVSTALYGVIPQVEKLQARFEELAKDYLNGDSAGKKEDQAPAGEPDDAEERASEKRAQKKGGSRFV